MSAAEPGRLTDCLFFFFFGGSQWPLPVELANLPHLSTSTHNAAVLLQCGARLPSLPAERLVGLNPGDIRRRDALRCHYPRGESHHHPIAERERESEREAHEPERTAGETAVTALRLQENCDDHAKKNSIGRNRSRRHVWPLCTGKQRKWRQRGLDGETHPHAASNHSRSPCRNTWS